MSRPDLCPGHIATRTLTHNVPCMDCPGYAPRPDQENR